MENNRGQLHDLFSRGSTPPVVGNPAPYNVPTQILSPANPAQNQIDSLFQNLNPSSGLAQSNDVYSNNNSSAPTTPSMSLADEPGPISSPPTTTTTTTERQNALLSLLGTGSSRPQAQPSTAFPQQVPTPPGSSAQRSSETPPHNDAQGKFLLEQLMSG